VKIGPGKLTGIFVATISSPTLKLWDETSATGAVIVNTFVPVAATYYPFPDIEFTNGLFFDMGGTLDATVFFE
jgi:hypothetical protein